MSHGRAAVIAAIAFLIASAGTSHAEPELITYKGFALGGTMSAFKERFPDFTCEGGHCSLDMVRDCFMRVEGTPQEKTKAGMACRERNTYGGIRPKSVSANFAEDKLVSVHVAFTTKLFFDDLSAAMVGGFGKPASHVREPVQNRMGATFQNETLTWRSAGATAILSKYTSTIEDGAVFIASDKYLEERARGTQQRREKGAKDL